MKKGYAIAILCLLLAIGGLGVGIYFDLFHETTSDNDVETTPFQQVIQEIEDSKDVGNHIWILPDPDGGPVRFRYDKPLSFTVEILKEQKAALLHTTLKTDYVTYVGYYELYYDGGWQVELIDGKPAMYVEESTYHYENMDSVEAIFGPADEEIRPTTEQMDAVKTVIEQRLIANNITDYEAYVDTASGQVIVRFPWSDEMPDVVDFVEDLSKTGMLQFYEGEGSIDEYGDAVPPPSYKLILDGNDINTATAMVNQDPISAGSSPYVIALKMTEAGARKFATATQKLAGFGKISIWLDYGEIWSQVHMQPRYALLSAPTVTTAITDGEAILTGFTDYESAKEIADLITSGALPFEITDRSVNIYN